jgi:transposase
MFGLGPATRIYLGVDAIDMRKGFNGLYGVVREQFGRDRLSGHLFLFTNRSRTRIKALVWDGSGLWVCAKRLEKGRFAWPSEPQAGSITMRPEELAMLINGLDFAQTKARRNWLRRNPRRVKHFCLEMYRYGLYRPLFVFIIGFPVDSANLRQHIVKLEQELQWARLKIQALTEELRLERRWERIICRPMKPSCRCRCMTREEPIIRRTCGNTVGPVGRQYSTSGSAAAARGRRSLSITGKAFCKRMATRLTIAWAGSGLCMWAAGRTRGASLSMR